MNMQRVAFSVGLLHTLISGISVPQSEETWAKLSQIAWVPGRCVVPFGNSFNKFMRSPQANKPVMGYRSRYVVRYQEIHPARRVLRLGSRSE
jgi:hypothetical protein